MLQELKLLTDIVQFLKNNYKNLFKGRFFKGFLFVAVLLFWFANFLIKKDSNQHYNSAIRDNEIYRNINETLKKCGDKSSIMIGAVNLGQKVGTIKDFYSCDGKICPSNTKEKNFDYRRSYVVDDATYAYLQEIGESDQVQTINLETGDIISPLTKRRLKIEELGTLYNMLAMSIWFKDGDLRVMKLAAIVDLYSSVIFTISFTGKNECLAADNSLTQIKQIINQSRDKNDPIKFF